MNFDAWSTLLGDYTLQVVALGAAVTGAVAGGTGSFAVLRRQSLLGDAVSHAALPGIALAFLLFLSRNPLLLLAGAALSGWLGTLAVQQITRHTRIKQDAALGIVLSTFFGAGMVLLTIIQRIPAAGQAGLDKYLFGNAATMLRGDIVALALVGLLIAILLLLLWKEFKLLSFDPAFAASSGLPVGLLDTVLITMIVLSIALGLQAVGVVLMSALIVAPAAAARQWTNRLELMVPLAAGFGALAGTVGAIASSSTARLPTGPAIVVVLTLIVVASLLLAPARGIVWEWLRHAAQHRKVEVATVLAGMYRLVETDPEPFRPHDVSALDAVGVHSAGRTMGVLQARGLVRRRGSLWMLTASGLVDARKASEQEGRL